MTDDVKNMKAPEAIHVRDVSELPETDRKVIAHFEAALQGARPAPSSAETAAMATMNHFLDGLREAQAAARTAGVDLTCEACASVFCTGGRGVAPHTKACASVLDARVRIDDVAKKVPIEAGPPDPSTTDRHWFYPSATIGCGLHIDDLRAAELTCLRSEVTCLGCLSRLHSDRETCAACSLGHPEHAGGRGAPSHVCDPALS